MSVRPRRRVVASGVTVDLWYTLLWFRAEDRERWRSERRRVVAEALGDLRGRPVSERRVERLVRAELTQLAREGSKLSYLAPEQLLDRLARRLGSSRRGSLLPWADRLTEAGLRERPPRVNPQARRFLRELGRRNFPVAVLTNSSRRPSTWREFLREHDLGPVQSVVTSSALGFGKPDPRAFLAASRRLGRSPSRIAHVGDCWHADVDGARRVGSVPIWYRGLFSRYPDDGQAKFEADADDQDPVVVRADRFPEIVRPRDELG